MQDIRQLVEKEFEAVNRLILEQLRSRVPLVENIGHYIVDAGGKRMRPMLTLLSAGACGSIDDKHIRLAAVIEFIHTATLLHDDVVDISSLRRGRPTANANWGNAPSVLVGDFLYSRAFQILVTDRNIDVMALLSDTTNTIAEGEVMQLTRAGNPDTSEQVYFDVITSKTAVLFASACRGSAVISAQSESVCEALYNYGLNLGIAFQLIDDILDYSGNPEETGKNIGDDLSEGKPTLPLIYTILHGSDGQKALVENAIINKSSENLEQIIAAVQSCGALDYCNQRASDYADKALLALQTLPDNTYRQAMQSLLETSLQRNH